MKTKKLFTVTLGIPTYNEAQNISLLIDCLLEQLQTSFRLRKIIIASDGSTDKTVSILKTINNPLVEVLNSRVRKGKSYRLDQIITQTRSDILVILDADIFIQDINFLNKLIKPIISKKADLTSADIKELKPTTLMQNILAASMKFKNRVFQEYKKGNNIYTCHGRARAFSKKIFSSLRFGDVVIDDAFSYLFCKYNHFRYEFAKKAVVCYKLPTNFCDHQKQSVRFFLSKKELLEKFNKKFVKAEYYLPPYIVFESFIRSLFINPLIIAYFFIVLALKIKSLFNPQLTPAWDIAKSSKV